MSDTKTETERTTVADLPAAIEQAKSVPGTFTQAVCHNMSSHFSCVLCGREIEEANAAIVLFSDGKMIGDVCDGCAAAGPRGAADRMREWVKRWRRDADQHEKDAAEVETAGRWATVEDLREAERAAHAAFVALDVDPRKPGQSYADLLGGPDVADPF